MRTPWGPSQTEETIVPGVIVVDTAGHGGVKLDRVRNAKVPKSCRTRGGWYEEDCEVSIVFAVHADVRRHFNVDEDKNALSLATWLPEAYVALRDAGFVRRTAEAEARLSQPIF